MDPLTCLYPHSGFEGAAVRTHTHTHTLFLSLRKQSRFLVEQLICISTHTVCDVSEFGWCPIQQLEILQTDRTSKKCFYKNSP